MARGESDAANAIKQVISALEPGLKHLGFRKRRHTFNRTVEPGFVQVISFQMGQYPIGDGYVVPGVRENLYGMFTVNLGVFVEEAYVALHRSPSPDWAQEQDCEFRVRLGELLDKPGDHWWSLTEATEPVANEIAALITARALPWFQIHGCRAKILALATSEPLPPGWPLRAPLVLGVILTNGGGRGTAKKLFQSYLAACRRPGTALFVREVARQLGLDLDAESQR